MLRYLILALSLGVLGGCSTNPLAPADNRDPNGRDTVIVITPCDTCPPDTTPPPNTYAVYPTAGGRIHEAQSHLTIATFTVTSRRDSVRFDLPVEYETGRAQANERFHLYGRSVADFDQKFDAVFPPTGTQVVPDSDGLVGWITRVLLIGNLPPGDYEWVVQQDLPNHHHPGESDIRFRPGTATVYRR